MRLCILLDVTDYLSSYCVMAGRWASSNIPPLSTTELSRRNAKKYNQSFRYVGRSAYAYRPFLMSHNVLGSWLRLPASAHIDINLVAKYANGYTYGVSLGVARRP